MASFNAKTALKGVRVTDAMGKEVADLFGSNGSAEPRFVGLYFSAHWCPPCRAFTPQLASVYCKLKHGEAKKNFEIVFCSWDEKESEFNSYAKEMPWARLNFQEPKVQELQNALQVQSIPTLVIFDQDGNMVSRNARSLIPKDPEGKAYPWDAASTKDLPAGAAGGGTIKSVVLGIALLAFVFYYLQLNSSQGDL